MGQKTPLVACVSYLVLICTFFWLNANRYTCFWHLPPKKQQQKRQMIIPPGCSVKIRVLRSICEGSRFDLDVLPIRRHPAVTHSQSPCWLLLVLVEEGQMKHKKKKHNELLTSSWLASPRNTINDKMSFDEILDLTADVFFLFHNKWNIKTYVRRTYLQQQAATLSIPRKKCRKYYFKEQNIGAYALNHVLLRVNS